MGLLCLRKLKAGVSIGQFGHIIWMLVDALTLYLASHPMLIRRVQGWLLARIQARSASAAAAGIAGFIGGCSVVEALAQAKPRF